MTWMDRIGLALNCVSPILIETIPAGFDFAIVLLRRSGSFNFLETGAELGDSSPKPPELRWAGNAGADLAGGFTGSN